jgi:tryptophanyl-tRNA synthetase
LRRSDFVSIDRSWREGGTGYGDYKKRLLELFHEQFDPARTRRQQLLEDRAELERVLTSGSRRARQIAAPIIEEVRKATGLRR